MKNKRNNSKKNCKTSSQSKRNGRPKEVEVDIERKDINKADLRGTGNDPQWYAHYPGLLENVTGVNFGAPVGSELELGLPDDDTGGYNTTISGICTVHFVPTLGSCSRISTVNNANKVAMQLYSAMRWKLGSTASYEASDIMLYLGAMDSAFMLYALSVKIYGLLRVRSPFNYYYGEVILNSMGIDYGTFANNGENFRSMINQYAIFLSSLFVPSDFDIFKRHVWLLTNNFTDSNTAKAQIYQLMMDGYYTYEEASEVGGAGYLKFNAMPASLTYDTWVTMINTVMGKILGSSDFNQMSADIGKAFEGATFSVALIPEDYITPISYSQEVLSQLENATLVGQVAADYKPNTAIKNDGNLNILQNIAGNQSIARIYQNAYFYPNVTYSYTLANQQYTENLFNAKRILNMHKADVSRDDVMVATRAMIGSVGVTTGETPSSSLTKPYVRPTEYGTEIYTYAVLTRVSRGSTTPVLDNIMYSFINGLPQDTGQIGTILNFVSQWTQFDWAPMCMLYYSNHTPLLCDVDNYAVVDDVQLKALHNCAVLSEFYSPKFPQVG